MATICLNSHIFFAHQLLNSIQKKIYIRKKKESGNFFCCGFSYNCIFSLKKNPLHKDVLFNTNNSARREFSETPKFPFCPCECVFCIRMMQKKNSKTEQMNYSWKYSLVLIFGKNFHILWMMVVEIYRVEPDVKLSTLMQFFLWILCIFYTLFYGKEIDVFHFANKI